MIQKNTILSKLGYLQYRPLQEEAIDALCAGTDVLLAAPTGGGKSLVYQSAGLIRDGVGVIISPLIALMAQQVESLKDKGVNAHFLNSNLQPDEHDDLVWALRNNHIDLLFLSPEKLMQPSVMSFLNSLSISLFAVDEAHCITQWGSSFRPEYSQLGQLRQNFPDVPIIALTGTVDGSTVKAIQASLKMQHALVLKSSFDRKNIEIQIAQKRKSKRQILYFLHHEMAGESGIIYCRSRKKTEQLASWLTQLGLPSLPYHAAMNDRARQENHQRFSTQPGLIMVATTAYGMGIDIAHIRFVIHVDLPDSPEAYFQEIGRAGRDGKPSKALLLYGLQDMLNAQRFNGLQDQLDDDRKERLSAFLQVLEGRGCRRKNLLKHFDESAQDCGNCDRCLAPSAEQNSTIASQKLLSLIYHTRGIQPFSVLIQLLLGKRTKGVSAIQGERLSLFGKGKELNEAQWKAVVRHLIAFDYIEVHQMPVFCVHLKEKARGILRSQAQILLPQERYYPLLGSEEDLNETATWHKLMSWKLSQVNHTLSDNQLRKVYQYKPNSIASLSRLTGLSKETVATFAASLLSLLEDNEVQEESNYVC
ncbi:RecQ family ATP-dependent DNA helicase [Marinomonas pollencensis]|uniref:ATP-dependent DNA helicase RecQ n=1 Tax=Marinomonas pollencensis TaxID=491954 RepID=A0A3E0DRG6_9GAMM|nr:RecQ family ATP-dependent DNA helicase [Marinomonas pollencensis]REG85701.1 ATP-dependent DNA helicase RecQ [Marinomonas pollencensis]